jgi:aspartate aminotransferase
VGAYRTPEGKPWILPVVKKAENILAKHTENETINHEYLPVLGFESFTTAAAELVLGKTSPAISEDRMTAVQSLSGTGALRTGADFLCKQLKFDTFYMSDPTWGNHGLIFKTAGFANARKYRYWDQPSRSFDFEGMLEDMRNAPPNSVIILHAIAHNPTGVDPSREQWKAIADVMKERSLFPFFDSAYQGFASGDLEADAWAVRYFVERGFELFCGQSFSKNFGLYNERAGNLVVVMNDKSCMANVRSQLTLIARASYSNPPAHGVRIVEKVLNDTVLYEEWKVCIKIMADRIFAMRAGLRERLEKLGTPGSWKHITEQIGMFSFTGLAPDMCKFLVEEKHVYLLKNGRISMAGVTDGNLDYLAQAFDEAVRKFS